MKKLKKLIAPVLVILAGVLYWLFGYDKPEPSIEPNASPVETRLMEMPALTSGDRLVEHGAYVSSYNTETLIPNWVAYELTAAETEGDRSREGREFRMDPQLKGVPQAMREDYSGSGWTKGHMMPAADAAFNSTAMGETFISPTSARSMKP